MNKRSPELDLEFWKSRSLTMEIVLLNAREKLRLCREAHGGEYVGGAEYTDLMRQIDAALVPKR